MAKTKETLSLEKELYKDTRSMAVFGCFEVTIGFWKDRLFSVDQRVDFMTMDTSGTFRAYEIKITKADFHSKCANSFVGHYNYYAMPLALYEQVKDEIPDFVGVWCGSIVKKPKRVEPSVPVDVLMRSMVRSLSRDADRYLMAIFNDETPENRRLEKERKKNQKTISELRTSVRILQRNLALSKGNRHEDLEERADAVAFYRKMAWERLDEITKLREEVARLRAEREQTV